MFGTYFFDMDGTLTDSFEGITNSVAYALQKFNIAVADKRELKPFIGPPLYESFMVYYNFTKQDALKAVNYYREYFSTKGLFECYIYEGIEPLLQKLAKAGKRLVVATSKPEIFANRIFEHFDLKKYFSCVAGATLDSSRITKADVIKYALEKCGITDVSGVVMVGDRKHDVLGAKQNGMRSVGVLYGYGSLDELKSAGADFIVKTPLEVLEISTFGNK